jgi:hypothetical protein
LSFGWYLSDSKVTFKFKSFEELFQIIAHSSDSSPFLKIIGVLSSTTTDFLTSINFSLYQNKLFFEFDRAIILKLVRLSGSANFTVAFQFQSVTTFQK